MTKKRVLFTVLVFFMLTFLVSCKNESQNDGLEATTQVTDSAIDTEDVVEPEMVEPEVEKTQDESEEVEEEIDTHEGEALNPLTGRYIDAEAATKRPFAVSISNIKAALPQSGIGQADIIYETLAEGGIPRLLAVFQDFDAEKIGPIRSARHYFIDFAFDFDGVYVHYGFSPQAQSAFSTLSAAHIDGISYKEGEVTYQAEDRSRPHATYTSYDLLQNGMEIKNYRTELDTEMDPKFKFSEETFELENENIADNVYLHFSYYHDPWFEYNEEEQLYYRFQYDGPHIDDVTGDQLTCDNIIIQSVNMWVISGDTEGRLDMSLVSSGEGYYITRGEYMKITWEKTSHNSPTHYYDEEGNEIVMNPGKTWISVLPSYNFDEIIFE